MEFKFTDAEFKILQNFALINPSMTIKPTGFEVKNLSNSVLAFYNFPTPFDFEEFGIFNVPEFIARCNAMGKVTFEADDKFITIKGTSNDTSRYLKTAEGLIEKVPNVSKKFDSVTPEILFVLSADRLITLHKVMAQQKTKFMFIESPSGTSIQITLGDNLEGSFDNYVLPLSGDVVKCSKLEKEISLLADDLKFIPNEYIVKGVSKMVEFKSANGVTYYTATI